MSSLLQASLHLLRCELFTLGGELLITSLKCFKEKMQKLRTTVYMFVDHDAPQNRYSLTASWSCHLRFGCFRDAFFGAPAQDVVSQLLQLEKKCVNLRRGRISSWLVLADGSWSVCVIRSILYSREINRHGVVRICWVCIEVRLNVIHWTIR